VPAAQPLSNLDVAASGKVKGRKRLRRKSGIFVSSCEPDNVTGESGFA
jgi:hypothetical protein